MVTYVTGDLVELIESEENKSKIICHICNDLGAWGGGFTAALDRKWPDVGMQYRMWARSENGSFGLGKIQLLVADKGIFVLNMVAQQGLISRSNPTPINYTDLNQCLEQVAKGIGDDEVEFHMPMIGTGLAGGDWNKILPIIEHNLKDREVYIYKLG